MPNLVDKDPSHGAVPAFGGRPGACPIFASCRAALHPGGQHRPMRLVFIIETWYDPQNRKPPGEKQERVPNLGGRMLKQDLFPEETGVHWLIPSLGDKDPTHRDAGLARLRAGGAVVPPTSSRPRPVDPLGERAQDRGLRWDVSTLRSARGIPGRCLPDAQLESNRGASRRATLLPGGSIRPMR